MSFVYLTLLVITIGCFLAIDARWRLAFFDQPRRAALCTALATSIFIVWDLLGISLGIFFEGGSKFMTGLSVLPDFPVEELFFLFLLTYMPLVLYRWAEKVWARI